MSGQQKLNRITRNNRVVAIPSKKKEVVVHDKNGDVVRDKNGNAVVETKQYYKIVPMH